MSKPNIPDLKETYSYKDTKPFGTFAAKKMIRDAYPGVSTEIIKNPFNKAIGNVTDTSTAYFCISRNLFVNDDEAQSMLDYVYQGNTLFISSGNIDTPLLAKLMCEQLKADRLLDMFTGNYKTTGIKFNDDLNISRDSFNYYYKPFANYFSSINAKFSRVIGYNEGNKPNCFILFWGRGRLILHCDPRAFSNYFLLKNNNYLYLQELLKLTGKTPSKIYWDDFYRSQNVRNQGEQKFSTFSELMKYPPLATAFWIFIILSGLYVIFHSKRRQKVIPIIKPNENSSIAFTETIARLYLQQRDNKNIADKMITRFNEYIRKNYFLIHNASNKDFITALSRKSGVSFEQTTSLFNAINEVNNQTELDDKQLLAFNSQIQNFYKNRN